MLARDFEIGAAAARAVGLTIAQPNKPLITVDIPQTLRLLAASAGVKISVDPGYGIARIRVILPNGAGIVDLRNQHPPNLLAELREVLSALVRHSV